MNDLNRRLNKEKVVIAKVKVNILAKNGNIIWEEFKSNIEQALWYFDDYKDKDLMSDQTVQLVVYDNVSELIVKQYTKET